MARPSASAVPALTPLDWAYGAGTLQPDACRSHRRAASRGASTAVDATAQVEQKLDALRAHRTQITVDGPFFALSNNVGSQAWGTEFFRIAKGRPGPAGPDEFETDLFAGL